MQPQGDALCSRSREENLSGRSAESARGRRVDRTSAARRGGDGRRVGVETFRMNLPVSPGTAAAEERGGA
ncbi:hypothetical protein NL676_005430 [Syzygium grande]|nr:hypothetical protein NL676_005430 [Syzygium grande]